MSDLWIGGEYFYADYFPAGDGIQALISDYNDDEYDFGFSVGTHPFDWTSSIGMHVNYFIDGHYSNYMDVTVGDLFLDGTYQFRSSNISFNAQAIPTPEPSIILMLSLGLGGFAIKRKCLFSKCRKDEL